MGIGAITAYRPYIYNTNTLSANSLNPIKEIDDEDLTKNRLDVEGLSGSVAETVNPLARGTSADYQGIVDSQFAAGMQKAAALFGDMSVFFNLAPKTTIVEAVRDINFLSPVTLNSYFLPIAENLRVLCGTRRPEYAEMVDIKAFLEVVSMARSIYRYVLIDIPSGFTPISVATAEASDITFLVSMISGTFEIQHMQRALEVFKAWPDYQQRVKTVFTRVEPCDANERNKLAEALGYPIVSIIPNEYMLVSSAANNGQMAIMEQPDSKFARFINQLADEIIGSKAHVRLG